MRSIAAHLLPHNRIIYVNETGVKYCVRNRPGNGIFGANNMESLFKNKTRTLIMIIILCIFEKINKRTLTNAQADKLKGTQRHGEAYKEAVGADPGVRHSPPYRHDGSHHRKQSDKCNLWEYQPHLERDKQANFEILWKIANTLDMRPSELVALIENKIERNS